MRSWLEHHKHQQKIFNEHSVAERAGGKIQSSCFGYVGPLVWSLLIATK